MPSTELSSRDWNPGASAFRAWEARFRIGPSATHWLPAREALLSWEVKTRSGFAVTPQQTVRQGARPIITIGVGSLRIHEPVEVRAVLHDPDRLGFSYATLPGHPVRGEEAFILERVGTDVYLIIRSLTAPSDVFGWRLAFPLLLVAQRVTRWRYARALR